MEVTEVRIHPYVPTRPDECLKAFALVVLDNAFAIRDVRVIDDPQRGLFLSMPERKLEDHCPNCKRRNVLLAKYCNWCGNLLGENRFLLDSRGKKKLHADCCHPITPQCREMLEEAVLPVYIDELGGTVK